MAAGWPEADAILPPAVFDNAGVCGEIGKSCVWIIKYFVVCVHSTLSYKNTPNAFW